MCIVYLLLNLNTTPDPSFNTNIIEVQTRPDAYIITAACNSIRFNVTRQNIERVFPNFFNILCHLTVPLNDSRISTSPKMVQKKFSSNLLSIIELWTYKIPKNSKNVYDWSFIFEDDVNFNKPQTVFLSDFIAPLQELMIHPEVQMKDGFFYLGICGPLGPNISQTIVASNTRKALFSSKGYGYCLHASAITAKRARLFWTEISSYRPNPTEKSLDFQLRVYSIRSQSTFYVFGANFQFPRKTAHYGVAFQDRGQFPTTVADDSEDP
jgi:hypothetical protein